MVEFNLDIPQLIGLLSGIILPLVVGFVTTRFLRLQEGYAYCSVRNASRINSISRLSGSCPNSSVNTCIHSSK
jgi:hypothetical protein